VTCHSAHPTDDIFKVAPKNLMLESEAQILQAKPLILQQVVIGRTMPLANKTQMTDEERTLIGQWIRQ
jgi:uncharacterized membrane protein